MSWRPDLSQLTDRPNVDIVAELDLDLPRAAPVGRIIEPLLRAVLRARSADQRYPESSYYLHVAAILKRHELEPMAIDGTALLYADMDSNIVIDRTGMDRVFVSVGYSDAGLGWIMAEGQQNGTLDGQLVHRVFMIFGPSDEAELRVKATIARMVYGNRGKSLPPAPN